MISVAVMVGGKGNPFGNPEEKLSYQKKHMHTHTVALLM